MLNIDAGGEFSIGQMAKLNCVSEKALRIYQKKGILAPSRIDEQTGYRFYSIEQCVVIDVVRQMQEMGFSLDEISNVFSSDDVDAYENAVRRKLQDLESKMLVLAQAKRTGEKYLKAFDAWHSRCSTGEIGIEHLEEKAIARFGIFNPRVSCADIGGARLLREWELHLRLLKKALYEEGFPEGVLYHVGSITTRESIDSGNIVIDDSFAFLNRSFGRLFDESEERFPEGDYLVLYYDTIVAGDGGYTTPRNTRRLIEFAAEHGYRTTGDCYGIVLADTPYFTRQGRDMVYKLCIRIEQPS